MNLLRFQGYVPVRCYMYNYWFWNCDGTPTLLVEQDSEGDQFIDDDVKFLVNELLHFKLLGIRAMDLQIFRHDALRGWQEVQFRQFHRVMAQPTWFARVKIALGVARPVSTDYFVASEAYSQPVSALQRTMIDGLHCELIR